MNPAKKPASPPQDGLALRDVLGAAAIELETIRSLGLRVERTACALSILPAERIDAVEELQQIDIMLQKLAALRDFMSELSQSPGEIGSREIAAALDAVHLESVRSRLGAGGPPRSVQGLVELF